MGDLSEHFSRHEFKCRGNDCNLDSIDSGTLQLLEEIRKHYGKPITVRSGNRCANHNAKVGGAKNSQHLYGRAADIVVEGIPPSQVAAWVKKSHPQASVGTYKTFTHVDTRTNGPAYWNG